MSQITFYEFPDGAVESLDALPDAVLNGTCGCGGTQFRFIKKKADNSEYLVCPTCGTPYKL